MTKILYDLLLKLEQCDDKHNRCDYLMEHDEITYLLDYITNLEKRNENLKEDFKRHIDRINELSEGIKALTEELCEYATKNEKAIEFIEKCREDSFNYCDGCKPAYCPDLKNILDLLNGDDE